MNDFIDPMVAPDDDRVINETPPAATNLFLRWRLLNVARGISFPSRISAVLPTRRILRRGKYVTIARRPEPSSWKPLPELEGVQLLRQRAQVQVNRKIPMISTRSWKSVTQPTPGTLADASSISAKRPMVT